MEGGQNEEPMDEFLYWEYRCKNYRKGARTIIKYLTRSGLIVWNVRRQGMKSITFKMSLNDALKIKDIMRGSDCSISEFMQREGPLFF